MDLPNGMLKNEALSSHFPGYIQVYGIQGDPRVSADGGGDLTGGLFESFTQRLSSNISN